MREWRKTHPISDEQKRRHSVRRRIGMRVKRGTLKKEPCFLCNSTVRIEAHHPDYSKPLWVVWLCRKHHIDLHRDENIEREIYERTKL